MHLNLVWLWTSFGPPNSEKQRYIENTDYRRADIGFSAILKSENKNNINKWLNRFNLFGLV